MFIVWVNQRKRKEEINPSKSSLRDPKPEREEHIFLMQLISSEKNSTTKINNFEGSEPEWLVPRGTSFFAFGRGQDFWEGERKITYWCMPAKLTISFFFISFSVFRFSSYLSFLFLFPCFLFCDPSQVVVTVVLAFFSLLFLLFLLYFVHGKGLLL